MLAFAFFLLSGPPTPPDAWAVLFPPLGNYTLKLSPPIIEKGDKPSTYRQSGRYDWNGGRFETITVTLARDPKFKEKYAADAIKKEKPEPEKLEINKKTAYLWVFEPEKDIQKVAKRLVVILADDTVIVIEQQGYGLDLAAVAKKFDFDKVAKALESPPPVKQK